MRHFYSSFGLLLGFIAIGIAAFETRPTASEARKDDWRTLGESAAAAGKRVLKEKVLREKPAPPPSEPLHPVRITYTLLGLAAMGLGAFSWIKKEHPRMSASSFAVGLIAACWPWVVIGVCMAVVILILAFFSV